MKTGATDIAGRNIRVGDRVEFEYHGSIEGVEGKQSGVVANFDGQNCIMWAGGSVPFGPHGYATDIRVIE
jgi:hypothetical protein